MTAYGTGNCQTFSLPTLYLDSLLFLAERGVSCEKVIVAQSNQIEVMGRQLIAYEGATAMQSRQLLTLDSLATGLRQEVKVVEDIGNERLKIEKKNSRRFKIAAALEGLLILILLI